MEMVVLGLDFPVVAMGQPRLAMTIGGSLLLCLEPSAARGLAYWRARCLGLLRWQKVGECKTAMVRCWLVRYLGHLNQDHK